MANPPLKIGLLVEAIEAYEKYGSQHKAAEALNLSRSTFQNRLKEAQRRRVRPAGFELMQEPPPEVDVEDLLDRRKAQFERKKTREEWARLIDVRVQVEGPYGVLHFGDPHVDDDGTDLALLEKHSTLVRETDAVFGANIGDTTNNWVGRLAALWAEQSTSSAEALALAKWFLESTGSWLYVIDGNHDLWSGEVNATVIDWCLKGLRLGVHQSSEVRVNLRPPKGAPCRINARHDFAGHSQWNPAHGVMKSLQLGVRDHVAVCGHKHTSGYGVVKCPQTLITCHGLQIGSYKMFDRYKKERGFRDMSLGPAAFTLIRPELPDTHPDFVKVFWDPEYGVDVLKFLRKRSKA